MRAKIIGITNLEIRHLCDDATTRINIEMVADTGYNANHLLYEKWDDIFPGNVLVPCRYCGQYAARRTACVHCGAPVD